MRAAVERFRAHLIAEAASKGKTVVARPEPPAGAPALLDIAVVLLEDLSRAVAAVAEGKGVLCLRQATESEAASDQGIEELRQTLQAPRIILA